MQPRMLIGQIDCFLLSLKRALTEKFAAEKNVDQVLYNKKTRRNHWQGILNELFKIASLDLSAFQSVEELENYFSVMYQSTATIQRATSEDEKQKSPIYVYCRANQINCQAIKTYSIDIFCKIINFLALFIHEKYLLTKFNDDDTANSLAKRLEEINKEYQKLITTLNTQQDSYFAEQIQQMEVIIDVLCKKLKKLGYLTIESGENSQGIIFPTSDFCLNLDEWLLCLPNEATNHSSSLVAQLHGNAQTAKNNGDEEQLYHYRLEALAHSHRIKEVTIHLQGKIKSFLESNEFKFKQLKQAVASIVEFKNNNQALIEHTKRIITLFTQMRNGLLPAVSSQKARSYQNLQEAMHSMRRLVKFTSDEIITFNRFHENMCNFFNGYSEQGEAVRQFNSNQKLVKKINANKSVLCDQLSKKIEKAKNDWQEVCKTLFSTAEQYEKILHFKANISLSQHIKRNWKISVLTCVGMLFSFSLLGSLLALSVATLVVIAISSGICGLLAGFASGLLIDQLTQKKIPHPAVIMEDYFPDPLPYEQNKDSYVVMFSSGLTPASSPSISSQQRPPSRTPPSTHMSLSDQEELVAIHSFSLKK